MSHIPINTLKNFMRNVLLLTPKPRSEELEVSCPKNPESRIQARLPPKPPKNSIMIILSGTTSYLERFMR